MPTASAATSKSTMYFFQVNGQNTSRISIICQIVLGWTWLKTFCLAAERKRRTAPLLSCLGAPCRSGRDSLLEKAELVAEEQGVPYGYFEGCSLKLVMEFEESYEINAGLGGNISSCTEMRVPDECVLGGVSRLGVSKSNVGAGRIGDISFKSSLRMKNIPAIL